jgi:aspartate/glutamate racemase
MILGCTEIPLLVRPGHCGTLPFHTTVLPAERASEYAVQQGQLRRHA